MWVCHSETDAWIINWFVSFHRNKAELKVIFVLTVLMYRQLKVEQQTQKEFKITARVQGACGVTFLCLFRPLNLWISSQADISLSWQQSPSSSNNKAFSFCLILHNDIIKVIQFSNNNWLNIAFVFNAVSFASRQWVQHFCHYSQEKQFQSATINEGSDGASVQCSLTSLTCFCLLLWLNVEPEHLLHMSLLAGTQRT